MTFPDSVEEFMESYKMVDTEHIYSNGTEYVPIFRMKQWFEHLDNANVNKNEGVSRYIDFYLIGELVDSHGNVHYEDLKNLPSADVVEVVRCEDCVYYENFLCGRFSAYGDSVEEPEYDYCSYGERREDEQIL